MLEDICQIFLEQQGITSNSRKLDRELQRLILEADRDKLKVSEDYLTDLIFKAAATGENNGFHSGFICAVQLLIPCFPKC